MIPQPIPTPAFAPSPSSPPFATRVDVCGVEDELEVLVEVVRDEDKGVVEFAEDVELGDAAMVDTAEPTAKVASSADGAGAANVSSVGMSQRIEPFV